MAKHIGEIGFIGDYTTQFLCGTQTFGAFFG
jgi:hypothetical protein